MPFNGSGTFAAPVVAGWPPTTGNVISSTAVDTVIDDIHSGLSSVLPRDGQAAMTGDLDLGSQDIVNGTNAVFSGTIEADIGLFPKREVITGYVAATAPGAVVKVSADTTLETGLAAGTTFWIHNTSTGSISLLSGAGLTFRVAGAGDYTPRLAPYGFCEIFVLSSTIYLAHGGQSLTGI